MIDVMIQDVTGKQIDTKVFSGGEVHVEIPSYSSRKHYVDFIEVTARIRSAQDAMSLFMVMSAIEHNYNSKHTTIKIPYFPYARQDRVCSPGQAFGLKKFAELLNTCKYDELWVTDPHSDVIYGCFDNRLNVITQEEVLSQCKHSIERINGLQMDLSYDCIVAPDAGASKKASKIASMFNLPLVQCLKKRDPQTGNLSGFEVCGHVTSSCLIVDDICDGGGTFVGIAEKLKEGGSQHIDLFVTHGIFSKGLGVFDGKINGIFTTNSFADKNTEELLRNNYPRSSDFPCKLHVIKI